MKLRKRDIILRILFPPLLKCSFNQCPLNTSYHCSFVVPCTTRVSGSAVKPACHTSHKAHTSFGFVFVFIFLTCTLINYCIAT